MKRAAARSTVGALAGALALAAGGAVAADRERTGVVRRDIALAPEVREVAIDNVIGALRVRAGAADRVTLEIVQHATAREEAALDAAFREVSLDVSTEGDRLLLVQDGPFRCETAGSRLGRGRGCTWDPEYSVRWDWSVEVPPGVDLEAGTVNGGALDVAGVTGRVRASNVNGPLRLAGLAGAVDASTVNGDLVAEYSRSPVSASRFETVNGRVELALPRDTSAELGFSTLHGEIWTDFEVTAVPSRPEITAEPGARARFRFDRDTVVRVGAGGVRLDCETVNGDILVRAR